MNINCLIIPLEALIPPLLPVSEIDSNHGLKFHIMPGGTSEICHFAHRLALVPTPD